METIFYVLLVNFSNFTLCIKNANYTKIWREKIWQTKLDFGREPWQRQQKTTDKRWPYPCLRLVRRKTILFFCLFFNHLISNPSPHPNLIAGVGKCCANSSPVATLCATGGTRFALLLEVRKWKYDLSWGSG